MPPRIKCLLSSLKAFISPSFSSRQVQGAQEPWAAFLPYRNLSSTWRADCLAGREWGELHRYVVYSLECHGLQEAGQAGSQEVAWGTKVLQEKAVSTLNSTQLWRMSLAWAGTIRKLGSSWEAKKEESVRQCHFFSNFTLKLFLVTQIFHPNLVIFFKRNQLRKCFISTVGSSHDGLTSPHQSYYRIHLEDVWYHHACLIHPKPHFFVLHWWSA